MRSLLAALSAIVLVSLFWFVLSLEPPAVHLVGAGESARVRGSEADSVELLVEVGPSSSTAKAAAARTIAAEIEPGAPCPDGFSQLVVRVRESGAPVEGARVEVPSDADALLNGEPDEEGRGVADARGEVAFYVRPTRQVLVNALSPKTGWSAETSFTTPFEGRTRVVELDLSSGASGRSVSLRVLTELGGTPLSGAHIEVVGPGEFVTEATTDEVGLALLPGGDELGYRVAAEGFVTKLVMVQDEASELRVVLRPFARLYGTVAMNKPVALQAGRGTDWANTPTTVRYGTNDSGVTRLGAGGRIRILASELIGTGKDGDVARLSMGPNWAVNPRALSVRHPWIVAVQGDGTWSIDIAIPESHASLSGLSLDQLTSRGGLRPLAAVPLIRPGDTILVDDSWAAAPPFTMKFVTPTGEPTAAGETVEFSSLRRGDPQDAPGAIGQVRSDGRVLLSHLPRGRWAYQVVVEGAPSSWSLAGEILQEGLDEPTQVTLAGSPLAVEIAYKGDRKNPKQYQLAIVEAGGPVGEFIQVREGGRYTFPRVPMDGRWEAVLFTRAYDLENGKLQPAIEEALRTPISTSETALSLDP